MTADAYTELYELRLVPILPSATMANIVARAICALRLVPILPSATIEVEEKRVAVGPHSPVRYNK